MNVCTICQADGVLLTAGHWYCVNHADQGFIATAEMVARIYGSDEDAAARGAAELVNELWRKP